MYKIVEEIRALFTITLSRKISRESHDLEDIAARFVIYLLQKLILTLYIYYLSWKCK